MNNDVQRGFLLTSVFYLNLQYMFHQKVIEKVVQENFMT